MALRELDSFFVKFMCLLAAGHKAEMNINAVDGDAKKSLKDNVGAISQLMLLITDCPNMEPLRYPGQKRRVKGTKIFREFKCKS